MGESGSGDSGIGVRGSEDERLGPAESTDMDLVIRSCEPVQFTNSRRNHTINEPPESVRSVSHHR